LLQKPSPASGGGKGGAGARRRHGRAAGRFGAALVSGTAEPEPEWHATRAVLGWIARELRPAVAACGEAEIAGILAALDGRPSPQARAGRRAAAGPRCCRPGAISIRSTPVRVPTPAAWQLGWHSAGLLVERHAQEHGRYPARLALSAWGTANMRTGGDDIAQALALIGARPVWEGASGRVTGFEILPASVMDRPRVDVTLRISGFFRDAFPGLIDLFDSAVRAVAALDEMPETNPLARACRPPTAGARRRAASPRTRRRCAPATGFSARSPAPTAPACKP